MNKLFLFAFLTASLTVTYAQKSYKYPVAPKDSTGNTYFNSVIPDPYQWMENPANPRLAEWMEAQKDINRKQENKQIIRNDVSQQLASMYLDTKQKTIEGYVSKEEKLRDKYEFIYDYPNYRRMPDLLYHKRGKTNNRYLVRIKDFQKTKDDNISIESLKMNPEQNLIAVGMSHNGGDWRNICFFNLETGEKLNDTLRFLRINSQIIWHENGVFYDRYKEPEKGRELLDAAKGQTLYYHKLGTAQSDDVRLYQNSDTTGIYDFTYSKIDSSKLLFYHYYKSRGVIYKAISYAPINEAKSIFLKNFLIYPNNDSIDFRLEDLTGDTALFYTTWKTPNGKVIKADINKLNKMEEFIPEYNAPLRSIDRLGGNMFSCTYRNDGQFLVLVFNRKAELVKKIDFPVGKKVNYFYEDNLKAEYTDFCISSFYHPNIWYQLSLKDLTFKPVNTIWVPYDAQDLETRFVKYRSKDGTLIPMYITCLKKTRLDGKNPTLLHGYGGYGINTEPSFDESMTLWLLKGGILANPNIRGGGEEGTEWAKAGRKLKKQNTIDDFIAAAEYLIKENYTAPEKLAISGASHGGMLIGAAITQRPELFKAAIAEAGCLDMLRFEKYTVGLKSVNQNEFGTSAVFDEFVNLKSYSPLHNIKKGIVYPNVLLMTGDNDDRVPPFHSYKFLATLQEKGSPQSLYQIYIMPGAGHSGALTPVERVDKMLFEYCFLFDQLF